MPGLYRWSHDSDVFLRHGLFCVINLSASSCREVILRSPSWTKCPRVGLFLLRKNTEGGRRLSAKYARFNSSGTNGNQRQNEESASKICLRCKTAKKLSEFYRNQGWSAQSGHDAWCKECATSYCVNKGTLREYCWYNNRGWADEFYEKALTKARYSLSSDPVYVAAPDGRKAR